MSLPATLTPLPAKKSWRCSRAFTPVATPSSSSPTSRTSPPTPTASSASATAKSKKTNPPPARSRSLLRGRLFLMSHPERTEGPLLFLLFRLERAATATHPGAQTQYIPAVNPWPQLARARPVPMSRSQLNIACRPPHTSMEFPAIVPAVALSTVLHPYFHRKREFSYRRPP